MAARSHPRPDHLFSANLRSDAHCATIVVLPLSAIRRSHLGNPELQVAAVRRAHVAGRKPLVSAVTRDYLERMWPEIEKEAR